MLIDGVGFEFVDVDDMSPVVSSSDLPVAELRNGDNETPMTTTPCCSKTAVRHGLSTFYGYTPDPSHVADVYSSLPPE